MILSKKNWQYEMANIRITTLQIWKFGMLVHNFEAASENFWLDLWMKFQFLGQVSLQGSMNFSSITKQHWYQCRDLHFN